MSKGRIIRGMSNLDELHYRHMVARGGDVPRTHLELASGEMISSALATHRILQPWDLGADLLVLPEAGVQLSVVSSSTADAAAGTGIRSVDIHYLDANLDEQYEELELNGTTTVTTVADDVRHIQCVHLATAGTGKAAAGDITLSYSGTDYSMISAGARRCTSSVRRVPRNKVLVITDMWAGSVSGSGDVKSIVRFGGTFINGRHDLTEDGIFMPFIGIAMQNASESLPPGTPFVVPSGRIVAMEVDVSATGCRIVGGYQGFYEDA